MEGGGGERREGGKERRRGRGEPSVDQQVFDSRSTYIMYVALFTNSALVYIEQG